MRKSASPSRSHRGLRTSGAEPEPEAKNSKGQALLIILLVMAVVLTVALSVASRSVTEISISQKEEEAARAFSAAEAGVEQVILGGGLTGTLPGGGEFTAEVAGLAEGSKSYIVPLLISSGETAPVWFAAHNDDDDLVCNAQNPCFTGNTIRVCWGEEGTGSNTSTTPALQVTILYTSGSDFSTAKIARAALDPHATRSNGFDKNVSTGCTIEGKNFAFRKDINLSSLQVTSRSNSASFPGPQEARFRLLYNTDRAHPAGMFVDFAGNGTLPRQGTRIDSTGEAGEATRKVEVRQLFPDLPPIFDFGVFSGSGGLTK